MAIDVLLMPKNFQKNLKIIQNFYENKTLIIAEAGVNHNGNINLALKQVDIASKSRADYVKFQTIAQKN